MTISPALRDPSRAGWIGAHVESLKLLTALESAIDVPKGLRAIPREFAQCGFSIMQIFANVKGKRWLKNTLLGIHPLALTYGNLQDTLSNLTGFFGSQLTHAIAQNRDIVSWL